MKKVPITTLRSHATKHYSRK